VNTTVLWKSATVQLVAVALVSIALALALPRSFFEEWGWLSGPAAWMACATLTARVIRLPLGQTLLGAALAGLPSIGAVLAGIHWLGALIAICLFAAWCARLARTEVAWTSA